MIATRHLPRRPLALPEVGFGAAPLGNLYRPLADETAAAALAAAFDGGLRLVDTAPYYGFGLSERRVGDAVRGRDDVLVSTKVGRLLEPIAGPVPPGERHGFHSPMPFRPVFDYTGDGILRSIEASIQRLALARIDILLIHDIGALTHGDDQPRRMAELVEGGGLAALQRLRDEGAVGAIGVGVNEIAICHDLLDRADLDMVLLAGRYTLLEQPALDTLLPRCLADGVGVVIGGPYNSGVLATGTAGRTLHYDYDTVPPAILDRVRRIEALCAAHGVALGAAALRFVLAHPAVVSVIPGLAGVGEVRDTLDRIAAPIPPALWDGLKADGLLRPDAPVPA